MARPSDLDFVRELVASQALERFPDLPSLPDPPDLPDLPDLPDRPGGGEDHLPAVQFPPQAIEALSNLPEQASLPDWLL